MYERLPNLAGALALAVFAVVAIGVAPARAHDVDYTGDFPCVGPGCTQSVEHEDAYPFKGWLNLTLTNTGTEDWGDFHFELFQVSDPIDNVFFDVSAPNQPTSNRSSLSWAVSGDGQVLDVFFYWDPVSPSETLEISVYTDNTTEPPADFFGVSFYPTPIPEPSTALFVASGLIGLAVYGRRRRA